MLEIEALLILASIPRLGPVRIRQLILQFGSAKAVLDEMPWKQWKEDRCWKENRALVERYNVEMISYLDDQYPKCLAELPDAPLILYVKGDATILSKQGIGVVGTRYCTVYGAEMAEKIGRELAEFGFVVVSGLARGIDTAAHRGALQKGKTIAVIGSGLAHIYPKENQKLSEIIVENGALVSELPMMSRPERHHFPQRNRIISGMSLGSVLIEAPEKSGAMITMRQAESQSRKLFALPGRADMESFRGNHALIKEGKAHLVENGVDVACSFGRLFCRKEQAEIKNASLLDAEEIAFLKQLPNEEISFEAIAQRIKLPVAKLNVLLMSLLMKKSIKEFPGKRYKKY